MSKGRKKPRKSTPSPSKPSAQVLVDIAMPIYGEFDLAAQALAAIPEAMKPLTRDQYRLFVVDNGTPEWVKPDGERVSPQELGAPLAKFMRHTDKYVRIEPNRGYPGGCNHVANMGTAPLLLILTSDVIMEPGCVHQMVRDLDDPKIGIVGPKLIFPTTMESPRGPAGKVQHAGIAFNIQGHPYHVNIGWSRDHPKVNERRIMQAVTGAVFLTRRSLWKMFGPFDLAYGAGTYEDMDYCFSVRQGGHNVLYDPKAEAYHLVGGAQLMGANAKGFALHVNSNVFRGKWSHMLQWDEYKYL